MTVTSVYYLGYPDGNPENPECAATEMYIEVGRDTDNQDHFEGTYSFKVFTYQYLDATFASRGLPLMERSVLIVPTLASEWILDFINSNISELLLVGTPVGIHPV